MGVIGNEKLICCWLQFIIWVTISGKYGGRWCDIKLLKTKMFLVKNCFSSIFFFDSNVWCMYVCMCVRKCVSFLSNNSNGSKIESYFRCRSIYHPMMFDLGNDWFDVIGTRLIVMGFEYHHSIVLIIACGLCELFILKLNYEL